MAVTLRSYAKINLGLAIGPAQADGFHALATVYQTLAVHDLVRVEVSPMSSTEGTHDAGLVLTSNDRRVPLDGRNTVAKMLALALGIPERTELRGRIRVAVHIDKRLPIQGGMGAGSANAAAALVGLERELARMELAEPLSGGARLRLAESVGSDVPLFLLGGAILGLGRGEQVVPLGDIAGYGAGSRSAERGEYGAGGLEVVVALPNRGVSTPVAFRDWDAAMAASGLTPGHLADRLKQLSRAFAAAWCAEHASGVFDPKQAKDEDQAGILIPTLVQTGILLNDFEQVVFRQHPPLEQIKRVLSGDQAGEKALYCALSGSGSALFGLYGGGNAAHAAQERLNALGIRNLRTRILGRAAYWADMVVEGTEFGVRNND